MKPIYYLGLTLNQIERNYLKRQLGHSAEVHDNYYCYIWKDTHKGG